MSTRVRVGVRAGVRVGVRVGVSGAVVAWLGTGCAGPPRDASAEDFCAAWAGVSSSLDAEGKSAAEVADLRESLGDLEDVGTPQDAPTAARDGLVLLGDLLERVGDDASQEDLDQLDEAVGAADQDKVEAFFVYTAQTCEPGAEQ